LKKPATEAGELERGKGLFTVSDHRSLDRVTRIQQGENPVSRGFGRSLVHPWYLAKIGEGRREENKAKQESEGEKKPIRGRSLGKKTESKVSCGK